MVHSEGPRGNPGETSCRNWAVEAQRFERGDGGETQRKAECASGYDKHEAAMIPFGLPGVCVRALLAYSWLSHTVAVDISTFMPFCGGYDFPGCLLE